MKSLRELPAIVAVTDEIQLRPLGVADTDELCNLIQQNAGHLDTFGTKVSDHYLDRKRVAFSLAGQVPDMRRYAITSHSRMIGGVDTYSDVYDSSIEIGYWLDDDHTGLGISTAAVGALKHNLLAVHPRLKATVHPDNYASVRVLEKNEFTLSTHEACDDVLTYRFSK